MKWNNYKLIFAFIAVIVMAKIMIVLTWGQKKRFHFHTFLYPAIIMDWNWYGFLYSINSYNAIQQTCSHLFLIIFFPLVFFNTIIFYFYIYINIHTCTKLCPESCLEDELKNFKSVIYLCIKYNSFLIPINFQELVH